MQTTEATGHGPHLAFAPACDTSDLTPGVAWDPTGRLVPSVLWGLGPGARAFLGLVWGLQKL